MICPSPANISGCAISVLPVLKPVSCSIIYRNHSTPEPGGPRISDNKSKSMVKRNCITSNKNIKNINKKQSNNSPTNNPELFNTHLIQIFFYCYRIAYGIRGSAKDLRQCRRCGRDSGNVLQAGDAMQSSVLSLISSVPATRSLLIANAASQETCLHKN